MTDLLEMMARAAYDADPGANGWKWSEVHDEYLDITRAVLAAMEAKGYVVTKRDVIKIKPNRIFTTHKAYLQWLETTDEGRAWQAHLEELRTASKPAPIPETDDCPDCGDPLYWPTLTLECCGKCGYWADHGQRMPDEPEPSER